MTTFGFLKANRPFVKVISGWANHDLAKVTPVVNAAVAAGAQAVDVAADPELVRWVKDHTPLALFASAPEPQSLIAAALAGADVVELDHVAAHPGAARTTAATTVLAMGREILAKRPEGVRVSVTIPGSLTPDSQKDLATQLQAMGVHFLQLEPRHGQDAASLALTEEIRSIVEIPVILSGGITLANLPQCVETGVAGLGVGRAINALISEKAMTETLKAMLVSVTAVAAGAANSGR